MSEILYYNILLYSLGTITAATMERLQTTYLFRTCPSTTTSAGGQLFCRIALRRRRRRRQARKPLVAIARTRRRHRKEPTGIWIFQNDCNDNNSDNGGKDETGVCPIGGRRLVYCDHCNIIYYTTVFASD